MMNKTLLLLLLCIFPIHLAKAQSLRLGLPIGHTLSIHYAQYSPDARLIVTASSDESAKIWEARTGKLLHTLLGHTSTVSSARFHPDGNLVVTSSTDQTAKIWNVKTGELLFTLEEETRTVDMANFSPTGESILTTNDSLTKIWDLNGQLLQILHGHNAEKINTFYTHDAGKFAVINNSTVNICDIESGRVIHTLTGHYGKIHSVKFIPGTKKIATSAEDMTVKIWDIESGQLLQSFSDSISQVTRLFVVNSDSLLAYSAAGSIQIWGINTGKLIRIIEMPKNDDVLCMNMSPDKEHILTGFHGYHARVWDIHTGSLITTLGGHTSRISSAEYDSSEKRLVTTSYDGIGKIWDMQSGKILHRLIGHTELALCSAFSPDGKYVITGASDNTAKIWDAQHGTLLYTIDNGDWIRDVQFSADGLFILTASDDMMAKIWKTSNGKLVRTLNGHKSWALVASFSPDGKNIVTASLDSTAKVWNAENGNLLHHFEQNLEGIYKAAYSPNGKRIITGTTKGNAYIYDAENGKNIHILQGHNDFVSKVVYSPDGKKIITTDLKKIVKIWDAETYGLLQTIELKGLLMGVSWTTNMVISENNSQLFLNDVSTGKEILSWIAIDSIDWVVTHPSGLFDASPGAMDKLYWVQGLDIIDFFQLKERYYEPGLWEKIMKGEELRSVEGLNGKIDLYPEISLSGIDPNGNLKIDLKNRGGGIGKIKVYINGKEIADDVRPAKFEANASSISINIEVKDHPFLIIGDTNLIEVKAYNGENWVISRAESVVYVDPRKNENSNPHLYLVSIGVSDYSGNKIDLKFPSKDAEDIYNALSVGANRLFGTSQTHGYLINSTQIEKRPTKDKIKSIFEEISQKATSNDVILIYLSGHGINWGGDEGDFYFLTEEAWSASADSYNDEAIRNKSGISSSEFTNWIKKIPALKQVLIIDACASGRVVEDLVAQRDISSNTIRSLDRMKDRTGLHIITGCAADAVSYEASRYGQGVLTYSLLEGMKGVSLREGRFLDIIQWFQYARERVPILASGIGGIQEPQIISPHGSESFDVGQLEEEDKKLVPLSGIKPMYIRSNFQDEDELDDILGLGNKMDEALNEYSAKGNESTIVFVDVKEFPDAYKLIGRYKREIDKITLTLRVKQGQEVIANLTLSGSTADDIVKQLLKKINDF